MRSLAFAAALMLLAGCVTVHDDAPSASFEGRAARYLESLQRTDGGFAEPGASETDLGLSLWIGRALATNDPASVALPRLDAYVTAQSFRITDHVGFSLVNLLALHLAYADAWPQSSVDITNITSWLSDLQHEDGRFGRPNEDYFVASVLPRLIGPDDPMAARLCSAVRADTDPSVVSRYDNESWYVAQLAQGISSCFSDETMNRQLNASLARFQLPDGSFARGLQQPTTDSSTTAHALLGLVAVGGDANGPEKYLRAQQRSDGSVPFRTDQAEPLARTSTEALLAMAEKKNAGVELF